MFEEIVADASKMVIFLFWFTLAATIVWGALWVRVHRKTSRS
jgi:hypothetical protein